MGYLPPFTITQKMLKITESIAKEIGKLEGAKLIYPSVRLRRNSQIKTIQASLAIEGNTLTLNQVTDIIEGKRIIGPQKDILEVKNAAIIYNDLKAFDPFNINDFLKCHNLLMQGLVEESGHLRSRGVGIFQGKNLIHAAPPPKRVPTLINNLFEFLKGNDELSWLIKSCIFHYELEFIHPFMDSNGRMGRLWQQLILMHEHDVFEFISVEEIIRNNQEEYYKALALSDADGHSTTFIEFSLATIFEALHIYEAERPIGVASRLEYAQKQLSREWFSRKDYLSLHKDISDPTASRDLLFGIGQKWLEFKGEKNQTRYRFII